MKGSLDPKGWEFWLLMESFRAHVDQCSQCKQAGRGRFCGASTEEIQDRRCERGKEIAGPLIEAAQAGDDV